MSEAPFRILLVEDNPGDVRLIKQILSEAPGLRFEMTVAGRVAEALEKLEKQSFDVILLDLSLPDSQGLDTFHTVYARAPEVPIVVLTGLADETAGVRAVQAGAEDYLIKGQCDSELLVRSIRYAMVRHEKLRATLRDGEKFQRGRVVGFIGAKGGVGTTTVALNVATVLASEQRNVVIVELRPFIGTLAAALKQAPQRNLSQLLALEPAAINQVEIGARLVTLPFGLRVLFGPQGVEEFREISPEQAEVIVETLASVADYVVLDLPWEPLESTAAAVRHCDFVGLVSQPEPQSVFASKAILQLLRQWGVSGQACGLVVVSKALVGEALSLKQMSEELGLGVVGVMAPAPDLCLSAERMGEPLVINQPNSVAAANLVDLTNRIVSGRSMGV